MIPKSLAIFFVINLCLFVWSMVNVCLLIMDRYQVGVGP